MHFPVYQHNPAYSLNAFFVPPFIFSVSPSQECQIEMSAHQATLDYVNQPVLQTCSIPDGQRGHYEYIHFAEEQGFVSHRWLSLQGNLNSLVRKQETFSSNYTDTF